MGWQRFIRVIPEGAKVPLYNKKACVSLHACGLFMFNRQAVTMAEAEGCEFVELYFDRRRNACGFTFHLNSGRHRLRLQPVPHTPARKTAAKSYADMFGLIMPGKAVRMVPTMEGRKLIALLPKECVKL